jgi:hypothetical protein
VAPVPAEGLADRAPVPGEQLPIRLGTELVQEASRALHVGKDERDGPRREVAHLGLPQVGRDG